MNHGEKRHAKHKNWNSTAFPYDTNYNDHFETPLQAYIDIKPVLDWLHQIHLDSDGVGNGKNLQKHVAAKKTSEASFKKISHRPLNGFTIYDPYYCNGRTSLFLKQLGFDNVVHEKRDFYQDISDNNVPNHDILITNPPYSDSHKSKCLEYCLQQLRGSKSSSADDGTPFLLLMPRYVASKQYYREAMSEKLDLVDDVIYLIPPTTYKYDHPENTGKDYSPFESLWYFGLGKQHVASFQKYWDSLQLPNKTNKLALLISLAQLQSNGIISSKNRPNPKQRRKMRKQGRIDSSIEQPRKENTTKSVHNNRAETGASIRNYQDTGRQEKRSTISDQNQIFLTQSQCKKSRKRY